MENIILFDSEDRDHLLPLTFLRPVCELRIGILSIREKWERCLGGKASYITQEYLSEKYEISVADTNYIINGGVLPTPELVALLKDMELNEAFLHEDELIAAKIDRSQFESLLGTDDGGDIVGLELENLHLLRVRRLWDLFRLNDQALQLDFELLTHGRTSQPLPPTVTLVGEGEVFVEEGARLSSAVLNPAAGPIYIGRGAEVMEGCLIRGPLALCDGAVLKMGAKIYGATTIGPHCKVGGEVNNSVLMGYSNKAHDGFLGNAVLGEWCNLGADTNNSNLKNNYAEVKLWDYVTERFEPTGLQFCGLIMGDHSKCGINTMFNTGTVVGVSANIFGSGFPRNFIPSFSWGGQQGFSTFRTEKAFETAEKMMARRKVPFTHHDRLIMLKVFEETAKYRSWEKAR